MKKRPVLLALTLLVSGFSQAEAPPCPRGL